MMVVETQAPSSRITGSNNYQVRPNQAPPNQSPRSSITGSRLPKTMRPVQRASPGPVPLIRPPKIKKAISVTGSQSPGTRTPLSGVSPLLSQGQSLEVPRFQDTEAIWAGGSIELEPNNDSATLTGASLRQEGGRSSAPPERARITQPKKVGPSKSSQKP